VVRLFRKTSDHLRIVRIQDADGNVETIQTTDEHPFFIAGPGSGGGWVAAKDLRPGDRLNEADGSNDSRVLSSTREDRPEGVAVYNFEVEGDHTYFVEDGIGLATAIWVHNKCGRSVALPLAPQSQGLHHLTARFENVPPSMWGQFPAGVPRPSGPINLIDGAAYYAARQAADRMNGVLRRHAKRWYGNPLRGQEIHEIVSVKFGGSPIARKPARAARSRAGA
jgi:hypothetical protein